MAKRIQWVVTAQQVDSTGYKHLHLRFRAAHCYRGNEKHLDNWQRKRLIQVLEETGQATYYNDSGAEFELIWQANSGVCDCLGEMNEKSEWYGGRVESADLRVATARALLKLSAESDLSPERAIEIMRAEHVRYLTYSTWVPTESGNMASPLDAG